MASSVADGLHTAPHKPLRMGGEALHKRLVDPETRALVGKLIERAIEVSGLSKKEAAYRMGYDDDQSPISRWIAGLEPPVLWRFVNVPALACGLAVALAELHHAEVRTVISITRHA